MSRIHSLHALEILDSRGQPTVQCTCRLHSGATGTCSVPSGASTGRHEAWEIRDGDHTRYRGRGCRQAVAHIKGEINESVQGMDLPVQGMLDQHLIALDGTTNKSRLGANALLAVSLAFARASATEQGMPLHAYFTSLASRNPNGRLSLPLPTINLFSGGVHAGGQVALQDLLIVPLPHEPLARQLEAMHEIYAVAAEYVQHKYGMRNLTADEGGLAPPFRAAREMLDDAMACARQAGLAPGRDFQLAIDAAASHFHADGVYRLDGRTLASGDLVQLYAEWADAYPLYSLEDGLAEDDWQGWQALYARLHGTTLVLGDDLLCTNPARIRQAIELHAADALLLKVNQIGTLSEALEALTLARGHSWHTVISARSGETEDNWLADLAVGWQADNIKIGSITQSERLAKYNRLLVLAEQYGS